ncbi:MAG: chemotaxis protein CheW [Nitrospira sp.]|nr:chemotaxis protein CheW [Nitrospira sp.]
MLHLRDRVLPLIRLAQEFDIPTDADRRRFCVVVAALGDRRIGVVVDELRSQEKSSSSRFGITWKPSKAYRRHHHR